MSGAWRKSPSLSDLLESNAAIIGETKRSSFPCITSWGPEACATSLLHCSAHPAIARLLIRWGEKDGLIGRNVMTAENVMLGLGVIVREGARLYHVETGNNG